MRSISLFGASLVLALLAACDKEAPTPPKAPPAPPPLSSSPQPEPAAPVEPVAPPAAPEPPPPPAPAPAPKSIPQPPTPAKPKEPSVAVSVKAPLPKAKLDLSLPEELVEQLQPRIAEDEAPRQPLLPPLFVQKPAAESPFQLNGKLLTNEREDDYWRSVEGAELQFEFKR
ncbi:hypothetical protein [Metapseudomonas resinovorans]|uniref:Lipoprotein n=1 Tax=Metapseudomonas resinovorans NBRC 106553 TaxID=1245471 RepID=S6BJX3_METRE|nr:hypothetical protein [Pseudomonas resinovorans]BAN49499.1 hypothetical protein PCA10_37670 [Pseudomonas resinovorans NBRC 106553]